MASKRERRAAPPPVPPAYEPLPLWRGPGPALYGPRYLDAAQRASAAGFTTFELARLLGVDKDTVILWDMIHVEFAAAVRAGADVRTARVEAAMYQRAVGYEHPSEQIVKVTTSETDHEAKTTTRTDEIIHEPTVNHIPADVKAGELWLYNHAPDRYRVRREEAAPVSQKIVIVGGLPTIDERRVMEAEPSSSELAARINAPDA